MTFAKFKETHMGGYIKKAAEDIPGFAKQGWGLSGNCDDMEVISWELMPKMDGTYLVHLANAHNLEEVAAEMSASYALLQNLLESLEVPCGAYNLGAFDCNTCHHGQLCSILTACEPAEEVPEAWMDQMVKRYALEVAEG